MVAYAQNGEAQAGRGPRSTNSTPSTLGEERHQVPIWSPDEEGGRTPSTGSKLKLFQRYRPSELPALMNRRNRVDGVGIRLRFEAAPKSAGDGTFLQA